MNEIWETIKNFFINFFQNGALTIVRCIAFFILGLIILIGQVCRHFHHFHRDGRLIYRARDRRRQCARLFYRGHHRCVFRDRARRRTRFAGQPGKPCERHYHYIYQTL